MASSFLRWPPGLADCDRRRSIAYGDEFMRHKPAINRSFITDDDLAILASQSASNQALSARLLCNCGAAYFVTSFPDFCIILVVGPDLYKSAVYAHYMTDILSYYR